MKIPEECVF